MARKKKSGSQKDSLAKILLATAILGVIEAVLNTIHSLLNLLLR